MGTLEGGLSGENEGTKRLAAGVQCRVAPAKTPAKPDDWQWTLGGAEHGSPLIRLLTA